MGRPAETAVCITGLLRSLLTRACVDSYRKHVVAPLRSPDTFISLSFVVANSSARSKPLDGPTNMSEAELATTLVAAYGARRVVAPQTVSPKVGPVLVQWYSISACFDAVERWEQEERRGQRFRFLYRLRTDMVFFSDIFPPQLLLEGHALVPSGGMSADEKDRCLSDHAFACAREHCRPYFRLLDLVATDRSWTSPGGARRSIECGRSGSGGGGSVEQRHRGETVAASSSISKMSRSDASSVSGALASLPCCTRRGAYDWLLAPSSGGSSMATDARGNPHSIDTPSTQPPACRVPAPPSAAIGDQWLLSWVYGGDAPCRAEQPEEACCGSTLREFPVYYVIARHKALSSKGRKDGTLKDHAGYCRKSLRELWRNRSAAADDATIDRCAAMDFAATFKYGGA